VNVRLQQLTKAAVVSLFRADLEAAVNVRLLGVLGIACFVNLSSLLECWASLFSQFWLSKNLLFVLLVTLIPEGTLSWILTSEALLKFMILVWTSTL
jgi:hypothetical protein